VGGWGSATDPAGGAYSTPPPDTLARLRALLLKGREGKEGKVEGREGEGHGWKGGGEGRGEGGKGRGSCTPHFLGESYAPASGRQTSVAIKRNLLTYLLTNFFIAQLLLGEKFPFDRHSSK